MRLPWPFGRAQRSPSDGSPASSGVSDAASPRPERGPGNAWRQLPPLAETVGPPPLVAPNRPFAAALAGSEPPAPILVPLSHGRSLEAPRGLIAGVARAVTASRGTELPRPVQRSPLHHKRDAGSGPDMTFDSDPEPEAAAPAPVAPAAPASVAPVAPLPIRRLEVTAAVARPVAKALTSAPEPALAKPLGLVGQPRISRAAVQRAPEPTPMPAQPLPIPAPVAQPAPAVTPEPDRGRPRLSIGQARRLGLGTPIAGGPIALSAPPFTGSAPVAADLLSTPAPTPDTTPEAVQRSPETSAPELPLAIRPTPAPAPADVAPPVPVASPAASSESAAGHAPVVPRRIGGLPAAKAGPSTHITSAQPLRTRVQRAPLTLPTRAIDEAGSGSTVVAPRPAAGPAEAPVKVHRDPSAAQLSKSLDARSFTHGGDIYLPASHGPLSSGKGKSLLAHELTHVTQQRRLGSSLPQEGTPHGKALEAEAVAAERGADMPLATPAPAPPAKPAPTTAGAAADLSAGGPAHASSSPAHAATGSAQRAPTNGGGAESGAGRTSHSEQELEDLASQLYARIGRQLRRELMVDRERAGFAMDLR